MNQVYEAYQGDSTLRDGGFIFQAILSYDLRWSIIDGDTAFDQDKVLGQLHRVDAFPDMQFNEGYATLSYVILSEVNLLKRKIDLASEIIKKKLNPEYAAAFLKPKEEKIEQFVFPDQTAFDPPKNPELGEPQKRLPEPQKQLGPGQKQLGPGQKMLEPGQKMLPAGEEPVAESEQITHLTAAQIKELNEKYFKGTRYDIVFTATNIVLREVSTSGIDSGRPTVTLKLSTGMVDTLDGQAINNWNNFKVVATGQGQSIEINNTGEDPISKIMAYDTIENSNELIFRTILPSLILEFAGDRAQIDTYSNRSSLVAIRSTIDFESLFEPETKKTEIVEPEEGEKPDEDEEDETTEDESDTATPTKPTIDWDAAVRNNK
jgi:hypothetical protein